MAKLWRPIDYIVAGEFADHHTLKHYLAKVRGAANGECVILLVHQGEEFFQHLCYVDATDAAWARSLESDLAKPQLSETSGDSLRQIFGRSRTGPLGELLSPLRYDTFISTVFGSYEEKTPSRIFSVSSRAKPSQNLSETDSKMTRTDVAAQVAVLIIRPGELNGRVLAKNMRLLLLCVNANAAVVLRRQMTILHRTSSELDAVERQIERRIESEMTALGSQVDPLGVTLVERHFGPLVDKAIKLTGASHGGIFLQGRQPDQLLCAGRSGVERPVEQDRLNVDARSVVTEAFRVRRPILFNDLTEFRHMNPRIQYLDPRPSALLPVEAELAVPVRSFRMRYASPYGVINVEKTAIPGRRPFSLHDVLMIREVAARVTLLASRAWNVSAQQMLLTLHARNNPLLKRDDARVAHSSNREGFDKVPSDFLRARSSIEEALRLVYCVMPTVAGATVRVFSYDRRQLVLLAAFPDELLGILKAIDVTEEKYPIARAARSGETLEWNSSISMGDFAKGDALVWFVSAPLYASGRLVGILTLASHHQKAFSDSTWTVNGVAQLLSLCLAHSQYEIEHVVTALMAQLSVAFHELNKIPHKLQDDIELLESEYRAVDDQHNGASDQHEAILQTLERFDRHVIRLRKTLGLFRKAGRSVYRPDGRPEALDEIVKRTLRTKRATEYFTLAVECGSCRVSSIAVTKVSAALKHLFANAKSFAQLHGPGKVSVRAENAGGRRFGVVRIENPVVERIDPDLLSRLYREPLDLDENRVHYGAYLAGALIRSLGGDIYVDRNDNSCVSVTFQIPLLDGADDKKC